MARCYSGGSSGMKEMHGITGRDTIRKEYMKEENLKMK